jgi:menaquinone-dependent protoporphyrinogen IX oxidase
MIVKIQETSFDTDEMTQLYPAAMIKTGYNEEVTQISLEWIDMQEGNSDVVIVDYAIFVHKKDGSITSFLYKTREALQEAMEALAAQMQL